MANVIAQCKQNRLICVLEVHDTTGYGEDGAAATLDQAADYWIGLKDVLAGQENYVVINIGNEPCGNTNPAGWTAATIAAIQKLRNAGFEHMIMVDAPNWGQDWQDVMRDNAQSVYAADTTGNLIFSIHMYGVFDTAAEITDYLNAFVDARLPIRHRRVRRPRRPVGRPRRGHHDGHRPAARTSATSPGPGAATPTRSSTWRSTSTRRSSRSWGQRIFNGANGIAADRQGGHGLRRRHPGRHPGPHRPRHPDRLRGDGHLRDPVLDGRH